MTQQQGVIGIGIGTTKSLKWLDEDLSFFLIALLFACNENR
jgi:hypothetical protein